MINIRPMTVVIAVGLVLCAAGTYFANHRAATWKARALAAETRVEQMTDELNSKDDTIDELNEANSRVFDLATKQNKELAALQAELNRYKIKRAAERVEAARNEEKDRAIPDCQALLAADWGVCPRIVDGMRKRSADSLPRSDT